MTIYTSDYLVEYHNGSSYVSLADSIVLSVRGVAEQSQADGPSGFGDETFTSCDITLKLPTVLSFTWARLPVRVTFTINGVNQVAFVGEVMQADGDLDTVSLQCESMLSSLPGKTRDYYSPLRYRRPPATKTTASSIEDPDNGSYAGGLINELLWRAGGRPYEQAGSYPSALFYYSNEQAVRAPNWSWVAGENGYEEALRLVQSVGGQIAQGMDGVIRYTQPLTMIGSSAITYTLASFGDLSWSLLAGDQYATAFQVSYTPRRPLPVQEVVNDTTYRTIAAGESLTIDLEPHWPIVESSWLLTDDTLKEAHLTITFFDGALAAYHASTGYTTTTTLYAMRLRCVITNNTGRHMQLSKVIVQGSPVAPGEVETIQVGSGDVVRVLEPNDFVQTKAHAQALATMMLSFYGVARKVYTLTGMVYEPTREVGDTVSLTVPELSLSAAQMIVIKKEHDDTGIEQALDLMDATGLPQLSDYWLVKSTSQSGTKKIAW